MTMRQITKLKRSIAGVSLYADTDDPVLVERIRRVLDAHLMPKASGSKGDSFFEDILNDLRRAGK